MITREWLYSKGEEVFEICNYEVYRATKDVFIRMNADIMYDVLSNNVNIIDALQDALIKYNRKFDVNDITVRDIYISMFLSTNAIYMEYPTKRNLKM
jgi:hypothetical protein